MQNSQPTGDDINLITMAEARTYIDAAIIERLGDNWRKEWLVAHNDDNYVRLNKGDINLDFRCDIVGNVEIIESEVSPTQTGGRLIAWMVLGASLFVALALAQIAGVFN